ncbi:MAG: putative transrane protein [Phenylobacterium sp.]|nr:putative transrane protein [Phenylobacterium sp.]
MAAVAPTAHVTGLAALLAVLVAFALHGTAYAQGGSIEYAVKAAYLYKFAPFVDWPPSAFASATSPFQLCILGRDPFGASLDQAVNGQRVDDHRVVVRRLDRVDAASNCHVLYLGASASQTTAEALRAVRGLPILTVADGGRDGGAIIKFLVKDNRVRFDIDTAAAAVNHMTISSKLLRLAMSVRPGTS